MKQEKTKTQRTLALVKPDGVKRKLAGECIRRFEQADLELTKIKLTLFDRKKAEEFRKDIGEKHPTIFESLIKYMTEGPMIAMILEGEEAIKKVREICGPTNPKDAPEGTIRGDFCSKEDMKELYKKGKVVKNIIHSSGSEEEARQEIEIIFGGQNG